MLADSGATLVEWLTLGVTLATVFIVARLTRRQSLFELRNQHVIRVYEDLIAELVAFGHAARKNEAVFDHFIRSLSKIAVARMHSTAEVTLQLDGLERFVQRIWQMQQEVAANPALQEPMLQEIAKLWVVILEVLGAAVDEQLGPHYKSSRWSFQNLQIHATYLLFKAKEKYFKKLWWASEPPREAVRTEELKGHALLCWQLRETIDILVKSHEGDKGSGDAGNRDKMQRELIAVVAKYCPK